MRKTLTPASKPRTTGSRTGRSVVRGKRSWTRSSLLLLGATLLVTVLLHGLQARATAQDFKGKTFVIMVASNPGGGTDTTARLIGRTWSKYLPGNPNLIIRNKPLQVSAANRFHHRTKPDGLTAAVFAGGGVLGPLSRKAKSVRYDPLKWGYIGQIERGPTHLLIRKKVLKNLTDPNAEPVVAGSVSTDRPQDSMAVFGAEYGGWNLRIVLGYPSSSDMYLAFERGEIDMFGSGTSRIIRRFLKEGEATALAVHSPRGDFPDVPTYEQLLGEKRPTGMALKAYTAWTAASVVDKFFVVPPGTPKNILQVLRTSYQQTVKDPVFVKRARRVLGKGYVVFSGDETKQMIRDSIVIPENVIDFMQRLRKKYGLPLIQR